MKYLGLLSFLIFMMLGSMAYLANRVLNTLPPNNPSMCLQATNATLNDNIMVTIGDSITHGVVSSNYPEMIAEELAEHNFSVINAGINSDLSITVLRRIDEVIACKPKIVSIMIGTNDIGVGHSEKIRFQAWLAGRIKKGDSVTPLSYEKNLIEIVNQLQAAEIEHIILLSPPLSGENLSSERNKLTKKYAEIVKRVAKSDGVRFISLNEIMRENIKKLSHDTSDVKTSELSNILGIFQHYFLSWDLEKAFENYGFYYLSDGVHLNSRGGELVADLILEEVESTLSSDERLDHGQ